MKRPCTVPFTHFFAFVHEQFTECNHKIFVVGVGWVVMVFLFKRISVYIGIGVDPGGKLLRLPVKAYIILSHVHIANRYALDVT